MVPRMGTRMVNTFSKATAVLMPDDGLECCTVWTVEKAIEQDRGTFCIASNGIKNFPMENEDGR